MANLLQLLRVRPVWVSLLGIVLTIVSYLSWPALVPNDSGHRGVWLVFGVVGLWAVIEWVLHFWRQSCDRQTRRGKLRSQLDSALRQLARECGEQGRGGWRSDAATTLPWLLVLGPAGAGKSRLLEKGSFRRIATCGTEEQAALCTLWLTLDAMAPAICVELGGSALNDSESCDQVNQWLRACRGGPDGLLLVVSFDDLGSSSEDTARALSIQLSPALRRTLQTFSHGELLVHVVVNKCDRIEGLPNFFPDAERKPLGFRLDRPLHTEIPAALLDARLAALAEALWKRQTQMLTEVHGRPEAEALLDFPREFALHGTQVRAFLSKLFEQFAADTRARLGEVFFTSASMQDGAAHEAARHRRLPTRGVRPPAGGADQLAQHRFVHGLFARAVRQAAAHSVGAAPRLQTLAVWGAAAVCVLGVAWMRHVYVQQLAPLSQLGKKVDSLDAVAAQLVELRRNLELEPGARNLPESLGKFLDQDQLLASEQQQVARAGKGSPRLSSPTQRLVDQLAETTGRLRQCESAGRLLAPMLRYEQRDTAARRPQPLYDRLLRISSDPGKRRPESRDHLPALQWGELGDGNALAEWLEAIYALVIARRSNPTCVDGPQAKADSAQSLARYFSALWLKQIAWSPPDKADKTSTPCDSKSDPLARPLCLRLAEVFQRYIGNERDCLGLRDRVDDNKLKAAQEQLERYTSGASTVEGAELYGGILLTLRMNDLPDSSPGRAPPLGLKFFATAATPAPVFTRSGCNRLARDRSPRSARLACLLGPGATGALTAAQETRVARAYQVLNAEKWNEFLGRLVRRQRPETASASRLGDLATDCANLMADLPRVFRVVGSGDINSGEPTEEMCRDAVIPFKEFRWATDQEDEGGGKANNPDLGDAWKAYSLRELTPLQAKLVEINTPGAPPQQTLDAVKAALDMQGRVRIARGAWVDGLKARIGAPMKSAGLLHLSDQLAEFEEEILLELTRKSRQLAFCRLQQLKNSTAQKAAGLKASDPGFAAAALQAQTEVRQEVGQYRTQFVDAFATTPGTCEMRPYPSVPQSHTAVPAEFCAAVRQLSTSLASSQPSPEPQGSMRSPSLVPVPENRPCAGVSIGYITLDVPELGKRFKCRVSGIDCNEDGPAQGQTVAIRLLTTEGTLLSTALSFPSLAALLARVPRHGVRVEIDPWLQVKRQQRVKRQVAEVSLAQQCHDPAAALRIYIDEDLGQRHSGSHDQEWMKASFFDGALSKLGSHQCL